MNKTIFFDESGNTGLNLIDPHQKFFSVGSTDLLEAEASDILKRHFPRQAGQDMKFRKLFRHQSNERALIDFAATVGGMPARFFCYVMDKRFALLCRMIDWLVEPVYHARGHDWYKDDYGRSYANLCHLAFKTCDLDGKLLEEVTSTYYGFTKEPSKQALAGMQRRFRGIVAANHPRVNGFMEHLLEGAMDFEKHNDLRTFKGRDDLHVTTIVSSIGWWRSQWAEDFDVIHDQSSHFFARREIWETVSSMSATNAFVRVGSKSIGFPLRVKSTTPGDSKLMPSLQICDLIAGFVARTKSGDLTARQRGVVQAMIDAGLSEIAVDGVEPDDFYATGPPPRADGPDAVDQVVRATLHSRK